MGRIDPRRGGSMIYVIMLMTMFVILSTGFLYLYRKLLKSAKMVYNLSLIHI